MEATLHGLTITNSSCAPLSSALPGCYLNCFLGPLSCTREWRQIGSSGPRCLTSSPSVGCLATTAWTSWTRSMSCCSPRVHSGATTTASMVALTMQREGGVSDDSGLLTVSWSFLRSNERPRIPFLGPDREGSRCCQSLRCLASHVEWTGQSFRPVESNKWLETSGSIFCD